MESVIVTFAVCAVFSLIIGLFFMKVSESQIDFGDPPKVLGMYIFAFVAPTGIAAGLMYLEKILLDSGGVIFSLFIIIAPIISMGLIVYMSNQLTIGKYQRTLLAKSKKSNTDK